MKESYLRSVLTFCSPSIKSKFERPPYLWIPLLDVQITDEWTKLSKLALWRLPARNGKRDDASYPDYAVIYHKGVVE